MYSPKNLTDFQKTSLCELYEMLKKFAKIQIRVGSEFENIIYTSLNEYFDDYRITRNDILGR